MRRVLISGASGLIGAAVASSLERAGAEVVRLVRGSTRDSMQISWDPMGEIAPATVSGFDAVIHLAGETIVGRWTAAKRKAIRDSRVRSTQALATALAVAEAKPGVFVCASAVGFYGDRGDEILTEESAGGGGFLAEVCREWETASRVAADAGIRTINLRTGLVLSGKGGALEKMLPAFKLGLGGRLGSGKQWWSWIHIDDEVGAIEHGMRSDAVSGPVNLAAPSPVRNEDFTKVLASVLRRPALLPVPEFGLKLAFGGMAAQELFLSSTRVAPQRLDRSGYTFRFNELRGALESLV